MQNEVRCEMAVVATEPRTTPGSGKTNFMVIPLAIEHTTVKRKQTVKDYWVIEVDRGWCLSALPIGDGV